MGANDYTKHVLAVIAGLLVLLIIMFAASKSPPLRRLVLSWISPGTVQNETLGAFSRSKNAATSFPTNTPTPKGARRAPTTTPRPSPTVVITVAPRVVAAAVATQAPTAIVTISPVRRPTAIPASGSPTSLWGVYALTLATGALIQFRTRSK